MAEASCPISPHLHQRSRKLPGCPGALYLRPCLEPLPLPGEDVDGTGWALVEGDKGYREDLEISGWSSRVCGGARFLSSGRWGETGLEEKPRLLALGSDSFVSHVDLKPMKVFDLGCLQLGPVVLLK